MRPKRLETETVAVFFVCARCLLPPPHRRLTSRSSRPRCTVTQALFPDRVLWVSGYTLHNYVYWVAPTAVAAMASAAVLPATMCGAVAHAAERARYVLRLIAALWVVALCVVYVCNAARLRADKEEAGMGWSDARSASESLSYALGPAGLFLTLAALMPVSRGVALITMAGFSVEGALQAHAWAGRACLAALAAHGAGYTFTWARYDGIAAAAANLAAWPGDAYAVVNLAGALSLAGGALAALAALPAVRRGCYEAFLWGHVLGAAAFYLLACAHACWICWCLAPATLVWAVERGHRAHSRSALQRALVSRPAPSLLRVHLPQMRPRAGHNIAWLTVPQLGGALGTQAHPFSFLPARKGGGVLAFVRVVAAAAGADKGGTWTQALASLAPIDCSSAAAVTVRVDGPHVSEHQQGPPTEGEMALVGGGVGVVPLLALLNARCAEARRRAGKPFKGVHTRVCLAARVLDECAMLEVLSHEVIRQLHCGNVRLSVSLTRSRGVDPEEAAGAASVAAVQAFLSASPPPMAMAANDGEDVSGCASSSALARWRGELAVLAGAVGMFLGTVLAEGTVNGFDGGGPLTAVLGTGWAKGMLTGVMLNVGAFAGVFAYALAARVMARRRQHTVPCDPVAAAVSDTLRSQQHVQWSAAAAVQVCDGRPNVEAFVAGATAAVVSGSPEFVAMALKSAAASGISGSVASLDMESL